MQVWNYLPMPYVRAFTSKKKARKFIKKKTGKEFKWLGKSAQTDAFENERGEVVAVITLCVDDASAAQKAAILAHECSHVLDAWMESIGEDSAGEEVKAYAIQCLMLACLEQLGDEWLIPQAKERNEK